MSNTVTLPRADWNVVEYALEQFVRDYNLGGGSMSLILANIYRQLDKQEYWYSYYWLVCHHSVKVTRMIVNHQFGVQLPRGGAYINMLHEILVKDAARLLWLS